MSYIVRTGRIVSVGELQGDPGQEYLHVDVRTADQFWDEADPESDTATTYSVMVLGTAAIRTAKLTTAGHKPSLVFAGRYVVRRVRLNGVDHVIHDVVGEHVGIDLNEELLEYLPR